MKTRKLPVKNKIYAGENCFVPREKNQKITKKCPWKTKVGVKKVKIWPESGREKKVFAREKIQKKPKKAFHG